jgi:hypothetical protein
VLPPSEFNQPLKNGPAFYRDRPEPSYEYVFYHFKEPGNSLPKMASPEAEALSADRSIAP